MAKDLLRRLGKAKKVHGVLFADAATIDEVRSATPTHFRLVESEGSPTERLRRAFETLLETPSAPGNVPPTAVVLVDPAPDMPLRVLKRAFGKLKHQDVVLGPSADGGIYLIGLARIRPELFEHPQGELPPLREWAKRIETLGLSLSLVPLWYRVTDRAGLDLLQAMTEVRRVAGSDRSIETEAALEASDREV
jgi:glycosyltransferase A (GT-A) superfamily protein (DUF2064 family)